MPSDVPPRPMASRSGSTSSSSGSLLRRLSRLGSISNKPLPSQPTTGGESAGRTSIWLDCDPGHDDAIALLLALHHPRIHLAGVSTVAGNAPGRLTYINAARLLVAFAAEDDLERQLETLPLIRGADEPLLKPTRKDSAIHGEDGLGGVIGLQPIDSPSVQKRLWASHSRSASSSNVGSSSSSSTRLPPPSPHLVVSELASLLQQRRSMQLPPLTICITGPCTNIAMLIKLHPELVSHEHIDQIVLMGGSAGGAGNRGPLAEFNILVDPEAAAIVFNAPVKVVMAGLNVTHQAIFTPEIHDRLLQRRSEAGSAVQSPATSPPFSPRLGATSQPHAGRIDSALSPPLSSSTTATAAAGVSSGGVISPLRRLLSSTLTFFASTYAHEFGFVHGPPVHDMLVIAYVVEPRLFYSHHRTGTTTGMGPGAAAMHARIEAEREARRAARRRSKLPATGQQQQDGATTNSLGDAHSVSSGHNAGGGGATGSAGRAFPPRRYRVQVECNDHSLALGATVVDFYDQWEPDPHADPAGAGAGTGEGPWGLGGKNAVVLEELDQEGLWNMFCDVVDRAETALGQAGAF